MAHCSWLSDNAGANTCKLVKEFLRTENVIQLQSPSYSPDFSPCDFFPIGLTKNNLSRHDLDCAIVQFLQGVPKNLLICIQSLYFKTRKLGFYQGKTHQPVEMSEILISPIKVRKRPKIRNRYNQAPHLTQYTYGKVTTSQ